MSNNPFIDHPASVGETYGEHLVAASGFGLSMILGGLACLVHGLLPFLFLRTGSSTIARLHERMVVNRRRAPVSPAFGVNPETHSG
ncbi:MAG TPA: DUF6356 family protein [Dongiaceae bacterium]|jgi:hypothetical protein|nr:DUF6356 family protein [Dongiaceae bacterium]